MIGKDRIGVQIERFKAQHPAGEKEQGRSPFNGQSNQRRTDRRMDGPTEKATKKGH